MEWVWSIYDLSELWIRVVILVARLQPAAASTSPDVEFGTRFSLCIVHKPNTCRLQQLIVDLRLTGKAFVWLLTAGGLRCVSSWLFSVARCLANSARSLSRRLMTEPIQRFLLLLHRSKLKFHRRSSRGQCNRERRRVARSRLLSDDRRCQDYHTRRKSTDSRKCWRWLTKSVVMSGTPSSWKLSTRMFQFKKLIFLLYSGLHSVRKHVLPWILGPHANWQTWYRLRSRSLIILTCHDSHRGLYVVNQFALSPRGHPLWQIILSCIGKLSM